MFYSDLFENKMLEQRKSNMRLNYKSLSDIKYDIKKEMIKAEKTINKIKQNTNSYSILNVIKAYNDKKKLLNNYYKEKEKIFIKALKDKELLNNTKTFTHLTKSPLETVIYCNEPNTSCKKVKTCECFKKVNKETQGKKSNKIVINKGFLSYNPVLSRDCISPDEEIQNVNCEIQNRNCNIKEVLSSLIQSDNEHVKQDNIENKLLSKLSASNFLNLSLVPMPDKGQLENASPINKMLYPNINKNEMHKINNTITLLNEDNPFLAIHCNKSLLPSNQYITINPDYIIQSNSYMPFNTQNP